MKITKRQMSLVSGYLYNVAEAFEKLQIHIKTCSECSVCFCSEGRSLFMDVEKKNTWVLAAARPVEKEEPA